MINSEDLPTYFESNDPQADVRYDNKQLKAELESLRQENARLRERMNQLTDDYEGTIKRLREALEWYAEAAGTIAINYDYGERAKKALNPPKNR